VSSTARRFLVEGRVQGVGFRWYVIDAARRLSLTGWARNLSDGRVEVLAQGPHEAIASLADMLREGPRAARVDKVTWQDVTSEPGLSGFQVKY